MTHAAGALRAPLLVLALACSAVLSGCAPLVIGGAAATTAVVVTDRRTSGIQLEDQNIAFKAQSQISQQLGEAARIDATAYEGQVLLTGDVPDEAAKAKATAIAQKIDNVKGVYNQLRVGPAAPFSTRSNDTWLASKVRTALLNARYVPSGTINVTVDRSEVYLMGKVTQVEGDYAATTAAGVGGITKVVKLFNTISREEAVRLSGSNSGQPPAPPTSTQAPIETGTPASGTGGGTDTGSGIQAMPIK